MSDEASLFQQATPLISPLAAAFFVLWGNTWLQRRLTRRLRDADELKERLYKLLELTAEYWAGTSSDHGPLRPAMESRILAAKLVVISECRELGRHSRRLGKWHQDTEQYRLDLMDAVTGGCFQQQDWESDPQRINHASREVQRIIRALNRAC